MHFNSILGYMGDCGPNLAAKAARKPSLGGSGDALAMLFGGPSSRLGAFWAFFGSRFGSIFKRKTYKKRDQNFLGFLRQFWTNFGAKNEAKNRKRRTGGTWENMHGA